MSSKLITTWTEHDVALKNILLLAEKDLRIFDDDLVKLKLERHENAESIRRFLAAKQQNNVRIVVKNAELLRRDSPRLMKLLMSYPQQMSVVECPPHLASISNALCLAGDRHALVRIHQDHARARIIIDSAPDCTAYLHQFEEIFKEGGEPISATTLGL